MTMRSLLAVVVVPVSSGSFHRSVTHSVSGTGPRPAPPLSSRSSCRGAFRAVPSSHGRVRRRVWARSTRRCPLHTMPLLLLPYTLSLVQTPTPTRAARPRRTPGRGRRKPLRAVEWMEMVVGQRIVSCCCRRVLPTALFRFANQIDRSVTLVLSGHRPRRLSLSLRHVGALFRSPHDHQGACGLECRVIRRVVACCTPSRCCRCLTLSV